MRAYEDVPKNELVSRCEICNKPFIYGWGDPREKGFKKCKDPGRVQEDGRWTHDVCFEEEE